MSSVVVADVENNLSGLKSSQMIFDGIFRFPKKVGQSLACHRGICNHSVDDGLCRLPNLFPGNLRASLWVNILGEILGVWVNILGEIFFGRLPLIHRSPLSLPF